MENILINDDENDKKYAKQLKEFGGDKFIFRLISTQDIPKPIHSKAISSFPHSKKPKRSVFLAYKIVLCLLSQSQTHSLKLFD